MAYPVPPMPDKAANPSLYWRWVEGEAQRKRQPRRGWCRRCGRNDESIPRHNTPHCISEVGGECSPAPEDPNITPVMPPHGPVCPDELLQYHGACFPMCQECWKECSIEERVHFHMLLMEHWRTGDPSPDRELLIAATIHSVRLGR